MGVERCYHVKLSQCYHLFYLSLSQQYAVHTEPGIGAYLHGSRSHSWQQGLPLPGGLLLCMHLLWVILLCEYWGTYTVCVKLVVIYKIARFRKCFQWNLNNRTSISICFSTSHLVDALIQSGFINGSDLFSSSYTNSSNRVQVQIVQMQIYSGPRGNIMVHLHRLPHCVSLFTTYSYFYDISMELIIVNEDIPPS